ncbi:MAG: hypothetical protein SFV15_19935 [Polyangiaceae bacterium]|nr:hypothetical protein [Polyangiaceae bacterium]
MESAFVLKWLRVFRLKAAFSLSAIICFTGGCAASPAREDKSVSALREQVAQLERECDRLAERVSVMEAASASARSNPTGPRGLPVVRLVPGAETEPATATDPASPAANQSPVDTSEDSADRLVISGTGADLKATEPKPKSPAARPGTP